MRDVCERDIQHNGERCELQDLDKLPGWRPRAREWDIDFRSPVRGVRGLLRQHRRQRAFVHGRSQSVLRKSRSVLWKSRSMLRKPLRLPAPGRLWRRDLSGVGIDQNRCASRM